MALSTKGRQKGRHRAYNPAGYRHERQFGRLGRTIDATSTVPIGQVCPPDADASGSKNDPKPGKNGNSGRPCLQRLISLFSLCYLLLKKLSKSLITLSDCPFLLSRLPVFSENLPVSGKKQIPRP
jgi:hypothetical protein